jgi:glycosyltransferase involved in cell wall biosynthesis
MTNHMPPLVSIGIPTYNRASSYLKAALRSAVNQTYKNIEIIVSDNCSSDNTESVVKEFNDPRIRYYRQQENIGAVPNSNFCLKQSQGKYFLALYDDDLTDEDFVSTCMEAAQLHGEPGVILTGARQINSAGNVLSVGHNRVHGYSTADFILGWFENKVPIYLCSTLFNAQELKHLGGFHSKTDIYSDTVVTVQLAARYGRADIFDIKASFRRHDTNMGSAAHYLVWCEDSLYLMDIMCDAVLEHAARVRDRGLLYFSVREYNRVSVIPSPLERLSAYLTIYKMFEYRYSPIRFLFRKHIYPMLKMLQRKVKNS